MKAVLFLFLFLFSVNSISNELEGICQEQNTASECTVINKTGDFIERLVWTLDGSWSDYGDEAIINLESGYSTSVSQPGTSDNCIFTFFTTIVAHGKNNTFEYYQGVSSEGHMSFDKNDSCTITLK